MSTGGITTSGRALVSSTLEPTSVSSIEGAGGMIGASGPPTRFRVRAEMAPMISMGIGKMIVELFSAEISTIVCS